MRQSLLNLRNPRYSVLLDNRTKFRIQCLNINKKFRSKRGTEATGMEQNLLVDLGIGTVGYTGKY